MFTDIVEKEESNLLSQASELFRLFWKMSGRFGRLKCLHASVSMLRPEWPLAKVGYHTREFDDISVPCSPGLVKKDCKCPGNGCSRVIYLSFSIRPGNKRLYSSSS